MFKRFDTTNNKNQGKGGKEQGKDDLEEFNKKKTPFSKYCSRDQIDRMKAIRHPPPP